MRRNRRRFLESYGDTKYSARSYYDNRFRGLEDDIGTDAFSELEDWVWNKYQDGNCIEVINSESGKSVRLCPEEDNMDYYDGTFADDIRKVESVRRNRRRFLESNFYDNDSQKEKDGFWYFTRHGIGPGSIPKDTYVLDIVEDGYDTYVKLDRVLSTKELNYYDLKERRPIRLEGLSDRVRSGDLEYDEEVDAWYASENGVDVQFQDRKTRSHMPRTAMSKNGQRGFNYERHPRTESNTWGRVWKDGKLVKQARGSKYGVRSEIAKYLDSMDKYLDSMEED